jgi:hypothetical protein
MSEPAADQAKLAELSRLMGGDPSSHIPPDEYVRLARECDRLEAECERALLGADCSKLQSRLFHALMDGRLFWTDTPDITVQFGTLTIRLRPPLDGLREPDAIEVVYGVRWERLSGAEQRRYQDRLRQLQTSLNDRLTKRRTPFSIARPYTGWLTVLVGGRRLTAPGAPPARLYQLLASGGIDDIHLCDLVLAHGRDEGIRRALAEVERPPALDTAACADFVRGALRPGPKPINALEAEWTAAGGRPRTLRTTLDNLKAQAEVDRYREGGRGGRWMVRLPARA